MGEQHPFKWRHFQSDIILLFVRWYLRYAFSYRDLEEMMREWGLHVDESQLNRTIALPHVTSAFDGLMDPAFCS